MNNRPLRDGLIMAALFSLFAAVAGVGLLDRVGRMDRGELAPYCKPGESPHFVWGFADLAALIGQTMGEPLECEHGEPGAGDTWLRTTTGTARYRWCTNTPTFTREDQHWAHVGGGEVVTWSGASPDPPIQQTLTNQPDVRRSCTASNDPPGEL